MLKIEGFFLQGCNPVNGGTTSAIEDEHRLIKSDNATLSCENNEANACSFQERTFVTCYLFTRANYDITSYVFSVIRSCRHLTAHGSRYGVAEVING